MRNLNPKWKKLVATEDRFYSRATALCDQAVLALNAALEEGTVSQVNILKVEVNTTTSKKALSWF